MTRLGHFLFHWRNSLFPLAYFLIFFKIEVPSCYVSAAWVGLAVAGLGQIVRFTTIGLDYIIRGGRNRRVYADDLVTGGLFAHCRNPLYAGNYLMLVGIGIASCSTLYLAIALPFFTLAYWCITLAEEEFLRGKFGPAYEAYCADVNRYFPRLAGLGETLTRSDFHWRRVVAKEYGSTFILVAALILVVQQNRMFAGAALGSGAASITLWILLGCSCIIYAIARYYKKRGLLQ